MLSYSLTLPMLLGAIAVHASPTELAYRRTDPILARQATSIPEGALYIVEWWPKGCGNGGGSTITGYQNSLATCVNTDLFAEAPADDAAIRFLFPDDGNVYKWQIFSSNDCSTQISKGETGQDGCFTVPTTQKVGAVIVYT